LCALVGNFKVLDIVDARPSHECHCLISVNWQ